MKCRQCGNEFKTSDPMHVRLCSDECKMVARSIALKKYRSSKRYKDLCKKWKKTKKGVACKKRWLASDKKKEVQLRALKKYWEKHDWVLKANKRRNALYQRCTRGKLKDWWEKEKSNGCRKCRSMTRLCIVHIVPICKGGGDEKENLECLCRSCCGELKGNIRIKNK